MEFRLTVDVRTALAIGAGPQMRGGIARSARDLDGYPMVPGTTLKGALRATAERILRGASTPRAVCSAVGGPGPCADPAAACVLCTLFGGAGQTGVLRFGDARLTDEIQRTHLNPARHGSLGTATRTGVSLDRASRAPSDHAYAGREATAPFMTGLKLTARLETQRGLSDDELALLRAAVRGVTALGGERSRGAGQARLDLSGPVERSAQPARPAAPRPGRVGAPAPSGAPSSAPRRERPGPATPPATPAGEPVDASKSIEPSSEASAPAAAEAAEGATPSPAAETPAPAPAPEAPPPPPVPRTPAAPGTYRLMLTAREAFRVAPNAGRGAAFARSGLAVPGSTLRGALAAALAAKIEGGFDNPVIKKSFAGLRVSDAIPAGRRVAPGTLVTCSAHPGFHLRSGARVGRSLVSHGAWDLVLIDFLRARVGASKPWPWTGRCPLQAEGGSGACPGMLVPLDAPYVTGRVADEQTAPFATVTSHRGVDRASGRSSRALLHAAEATLPGKGISRYEAEIAGADADLAQALGGVGDLRVGGGLSAGRGLFNVHLEPGDTLSVRGALASLEEAVVRLLETWPGGAVTRTEVGLDRHRLAVIDLASDWVPGEWRGTLLATAKADLPRVGGLEVLAARLSAGEAGGWNAAAGIAKPLRRTIARGGVLLASYAVLHENEVVEALETLAQRGVGRLTTEGFGQVRVSDPVHWERIPPLMEGR